MREPAQFYLRTRQRARFFPLIANGNGHMLVDFFMKIGVKNFFWESVDENIFSVIADENCPKMFSLTGFEKIFLQQFS